MVKLYSTGCGKCKMLKAHLERKKIDFEVCEISEEVLEFATRHTIMYVPILQVDNIIMNFDEAIKWSNKKGEIN